MLYYTVDFVTVPYALKNNTFSFCWNISASVCCLADLFVLAREVLKSSTTVLVSSVFSLVLSVVIYFEAIF